MPPYFDAVRKGVTTIMVSYSSWNGVKMHRNRELITGFLKNTLKFRVKNSYFSPIHSIFSFHIHGDRFIVLLDVFQGFVISDFMGIDQLTNPPHANYTLSIELSVTAGIDMVGFIGICAN